MARGVRKAPEWWLKRALSLLLGASLAAMACLNDTPTATNRTTLRAVLNANIVGALAGGTVGIRIGYRNIRQQFIALQSSPEQISVGAGATVVVPVTVDIGPCLSDAERVRASEPGCLLTIELTLTDATGKPIDTQVRDARNGPVTPGQSVDFGTVTIGISVSTIAVTPTSLGMTVSDEQRLVGTVRDANGTVTTATPVTWLTTDATVTQLTVTADGSVLVRGLKLGTASVTATAGGKTSNAVPVTVGPPAPLVITQRQGAGCVLVGQTLDLVVDSPPGPVTWSTNASAVTVSATGVVTGVTPGSANITATSGNRTGTATVCVTGPLRVVNTQLSVVASRTVQIGASGTSGGTVSYVSSSPAIATVDASGLVRGVAIGTATITVTLKAASGAQSAPVQVTVVPAAVSISPTTAIAGLNRTVRLTVTATDGAGASIPGVTGTWTIDDPTVGSLSTSTGSSIDIRGLKLGTTTVRVTAGTLTATVPFTATQPLPASRIEKVSGDGAVCPTRSAGCAFVVRALDANGSTVPGALVIWSSGFSCAPTTQLTTDNIGLVTATNLCSTVPGTFAQTATLASNGQQVSFSYTLRGLLLTQQSQDSFGNFVLSVTSASGLASGLTAAPDYRNSPVTGYVSTLGLSGTTTPTTLTVGFDTSQLTPGNYAVDVIVSTTTPGIGPGTASFTVVVDTGLGFSASAARQPRMPAGALRTLRAP